MADLGAADLRTTRLMFGLVGCCGVSAPVLQQRGSTAGVRGRHRGDSHSLVRLPGDSDAEGGFPLKTCLLLLQRAEIDERSPVSDIFWGRGMGVFIDDLGSGCEVSE